MSGIILQGKALKIVNKGGGRKQRTENLGGGRRRSLIGPKEKGTDYVVFNCPAPDCGARNKRSVYETKGRAGNALSFKCNRCLREIEVLAPIKPVMIVSGTADARFNPGLVGPDGRPL
jgi:hypothetical protein